MVIEKSSVTLQQVFFNLVILEKEIQFNAIDFLNRGRSRFYAPA